MKKNYCSPYLSIVSVKNDIIATSEIPVDPNGLGDARISGRESFNIWEEE